jgi:hypothetical protein
VRRERASKQPREGNFCASEVWCGSGSGGVAGQRPLNRRGLRRPERDHRASVQAKHVAYGSKQPPPAVSRSAVAWRGAGLARSAAAAARVPLVPAMAGILLLDSFLRLEMFLRFCLFLRLLLLHFCTSARTECIDDK